MVALVNVHTAENEPLKVFEGEFIHYFNALPTHRGGPASSRLALALRSAALARTADAVRVATEGELARGLSPAREHDLLLIVEDATADTVLGINGFDVWFDSEA